MNRSPKSLIKILKKNGFIFKRAKGSLQIFYNSSTNKTVVVPIHGNKDLPKGTFFTIIKQAGISKNDL